MRNWLVVMLLSLAWISAGCDGEESDCPPDGCTSGEAGAGGGGASDGQAGTDDSEAGTGGGQGGTDDGEGGDGGSDEPDMGWTEIRPEACTNEQASRVISTNLFSDVPYVHVSPRLEPGFSEAATVMALEENMTRIRLRTKSEKTIEIKWAGVLMEYPVGTEVTLSQTRDWTILRRSNGKYAAMFYRNGAIPGEQLSPLPGKAPSLRFAMQCNVSDQNNCTLDAVALHSGDGANLQVFESGTIEHVGDWVISNRSAMQSPGCPGYVPLRSLIWVEGQE